MRYCYDPEGVRNLADAIIIKAADDLRKALKKVASPPKKPDENADAKTKEKYTKKVIAYDNTFTEIKKIKRFFFSDRFVLYTNIDGKYFWDNIISEIPKAKAGLEERGLI